MARAAHAAVDISTRVPMGDPRGHGRCPRTGGAVMEYVGIDLHKHYSVDTAVASGAIQVYNGCP